jgi:hypothetical protein
MAGRHTIRKKHYSCQLITLNMDIPKSHTQTARFNYIKNLYNE